MVQCPSCGGAVHFDIATQKVICSFCDSQYDPVTIRDNESHDAKTSEYFESYVYICPSCGGELMTTDQNDAVGFCPYCGGASMIFDKVRREWKPDYVIPFKVTKEQCKRAYIKEVLKHPFVSLKYCNPKMIDGFKGIYMPYWYYQTVHQGTLRFLTRPIRTYKSNGDYTETVKELSTKIDYVASGYTHDAAMSFDDHLSEKLAPFNTEEKRGFHPGYLCGFYAEVGDVDTKTYSAGAIEASLEVMKNEFYDDKLILEKEREFDVSVDPDQIKIPARVKDSSRSLQPVWFMGYRRKKDQMVYAAVNGQTGKVAVDLPLSPVRIVIAALLLAGLLYGGMLAMMQTLPSLKAVVTLGVCSILTLCGVYILHSAFVATIVNGLRDKKVKKVNGLHHLFFFLSIIMGTLGMLLIVTDGTYAQTRALAGGFLLVPSVVILLVLLIAIVKNWYDVSKAMGIQSKLLEILFDKKKKNKANKEPKNETKYTQVLNGVITEGAKISRSVRIVHLVILVTLFICFIFIVLNNAAKVGYYICCGILMAELMILSVQYIRFQLNCAKRRPPQYNKKGAYSDET